MPMGTGTFYVVRRPDQQDDDDDDDDDDEPNCPPPSKKRKIDAATAAGEEEQLEAMGPGPKLIMERAGINVTQREESVVVQYLTLGGFQHWLNLTQKILLKTVSPHLAGSGVHAGPGQLCFGYSSRHRADLTLFFKKTKEHSAYIFVHNYH